MDLDLDGTPVVSEHDMRLVPVVAIRQNVYPVKGKGLSRGGVVLAVGDEPSASRATAADPRRVGAQLGPA